MVEYLESSWKRDIPRKFFGKILEGFFYWIKQIMNIFRSEQLNLQISLMGSDMRQNYNQIKSIQTTKFAKIVIIAPGITFVK